jgi:flagellar biogenesis protein FliO
MRRGVVALGALGLLAATAFSRAWGAEIPFRRDAGDAASLGQTVAAFVLCLLLLGAALWWLRRKRQAPGEPRTDAKAALRVVQRARLSGKTMLSVVEFDGERHLIAHSDQAIAVVTGRPPAPAATGASQQGDFR